MGYEDEKDVIVALLKDRSDYYYADVEHWYRIPSNTKRVPLIVKNNKVKIIAFYLPKIFGNFAHTVRWYADVKKISLVKRDELVLDGKKHPNSKNEYYKIEFDKLIELKQPIESRRKRRIVFITTTWDHLFNAKEINDLYIESPIEEKLWKELKKLQIDAERQYDIHTKRQSYYIDFGLFCCSRNIALECDGDTFHMENENVQKDKQRDNILLINGWETMRFTSKNINYEMDNTIGLIKEAVNKYGGIEDSSSPRDFKYIRTSEDSQGILFDSH